MPEANRHHRHKSPDYPNPARASALGVFPPPSLDRPRQRECAEAPVVYYFPGQCHSLFFSLLSSLRVHTPVLITHPSWLLLVSPCLCAILASSTNHPVLEQIRTPVTDLLKVNHPVLLAGMNVAAGPKLAAAVTNAGGLGVIGGVGYTPDMLREQIAELKSYLTDKNAPFGVDLLLPQVGGSARKTK